MVQKIRPNMSLPFKIAFGLTVCAFPFAIPPLKHSVTAKLLGPPLEEPMSTSDLVHHLQYWQPILRWNSFWDWVGYKHLSELEKLRGKCHGLSADDELVIKDLEAAAIVENWEDYPVTDADRDFVRTSYNFNRRLTMAIVKHKNYTLEREDIQIYEAERESMFGRGVELNREFKEALEKFSPDIKTELLK